eukprot:GILI01018931.1.p1 GENE.GILI01018931.1~~GILI01018931.1.p1  ORF type:complete len:658 (-),score=75.34 GILI01018931.1:271-2244(-)
MQGNQDVLALRGMRMWTMGKGLSPGPVSITCQTTSNAGEYNAIIADIHPAAEKAPSIGIKGPVSDLPTVSKSQPPKNGRELVILPGLIDSHVHFLDGGRRKAALNLDHCDSKAAFVTAIRKYVRRTLLESRDGEVSGGPLTDDEAMQLQKWRAQEGLGKATSVPWVVGYQWSDIKLGGLPSKAWLDEACSHVPILLERFDCHSSVINSCALELCGINNFGPANPTGGIIDRALPVPAMTDKSIVLAMPQLGEPTGVLRENAMLLAAECRKATWKVSDSDLSAAYLEAANELLAHGITSCFSMLSLDYDNIKEFEFLQNRNPNGNLVRMRSVVNASEINELVAFKDRYYNDGSAQAPHNFGSDFLRFGAVKICSDGSLGSRTAAMLDPYGDVEEGDQASSCPCGTLLCSTEELCADIVKVASAGLQCCTHAIGDRACQVIQDGYEIANTNIDVKALRFRIEHCQHIASLEEVDRYRATGTIPSVQPCHLLFDGDHMAKRLGSRRVGLSYAIRSMLSRGVRPVFGTDWMVAPICPISNMLAAIQRQPIKFAKSDGNAQEDLPVWSPDERISVEEALCAYTSDAAHGMFMEDRIGRIEVGYFADFTILDGNPFSLLTSPALETTEMGTQRPLGGLTVVATIVGGVPRYVAEGYEYLLQRL